jgi:hypothetical protein
MPYGDVVRVGGGCGPLYLNGQEDFHFIRGVAVRRIGAQGARLFSTNINMLKHWVVVKIGLKFKPRLFRLYLDQI